MVRDVPFFGELYRLTTAPLLSAQVTLAEADFIAATLELRQGTSALDLGCGEGRHLEALGRSGASLFGVDFDRPALARAARFARAVEGDLRALPFKSGCLANVYCWYSTLFVFDEAGNRRALAEVARILRPGGRLLFQTVNAEHLAAEPGARFEHRLPDGSMVREESHFGAATGVDEGTRTLELPGGEILRGRYRLRYYQSAQLSEMFASAGLRIASMFGSIRGEAFSRQALDLVALAVRE